MVLKNEVTKMKSELNVSGRPKVVSNLSCEVIFQDSILMKHFLGLTSEQFKALHNFLDSICPLDKSTFWNSRESNEQTDTKCRQEPKCTTEEMLFICILRLRRAYTIKTLAVLLRTADQTISKTLVRKIFTTYVQLIYKVFRDTQEVMFPTQGKLRCFLPKVFKTLR